MVNEEEAEKQKAPRRTTTSTRFEEENSAATSTSPARAGNMPNDNVRISTFSIASAVFHRNNHAADLIQQGSFKEAVKSLRMAMDLCMDALATATSTGGASNTLANESEPSLMCLDDLIMYSQQARIVAPSSSSSCTTAPPPPAASSESHLFGKVEEEFEYSTSRIYQMPIYIPEDLLLFQYDPQTRVLPLFSSFSTICLFNLALACHLQATSISLITEEEARQYNLLLQKVARLYEFAMQILHTTTITNKHGSTLLYAAAILNNMIDVLRRLGKMVQAEHYEQRLLSVVLYLVDGQQEGQQQEHHRRRPRSSGAGAAPPPSTTTSRTTRDGQASLDTFVHTIFCLLAPKSQRIAAPAA